MVRVHGGNKTGRPGVVLRIMSDGRLFVPWGTGTDRADLARVEVRPRSAAGIALGIYKPTFFYRNNLTVCTEDTVEIVGDLCPPELFLQVKRLYGI